MMFVSVNSNIMGVICGTGVLSLPEHLNSSQVLEGIVLLDL